MAVLVAHRPSKYHLVRFEYCCADPSVPPARAPRRYPLFQAEVVNFQINMPLKIGRWKLHFPNCTYLLYSYL